MHHSRIDDLTRFVARRTGRRTLVTGALGGLLVALAPGLQTLDAGARQKPRRSKQRLCKKPRRRCGKRCVNVRTNRQHCGTCGRRCKPGHACRGGKCKPRPCGKGGPCLVFVTDHWHTGEMGGLAGADAICTRAAREADLPGNFKAWLSSQNGSPYSRFTRNPGPYVLRDGTRIANSWADLIDGALIAPINLTESNVRLDAAPVWTATTPQGKWRSGDCLAWTTRAPERIGAVGDTDQTGEQWTDGPVRPCGEGNHLYCFQQS